MRPNESLVRQAIKDRGGFKPATRWLREQGYEIGETSVRVMGRSLTRQEPEFELDLPGGRMASEVDIDALIARRIEEYGRKQTVYDRERIIPINVNIDGPLGIGFVGDPHVDDDGTDLAQVFEHARIFDGRNPGLFAGNIGDITNNWTGRLARLWADQSTSAAEARALATEYLQMVRWLFFIKGNHDCVSADTELLTKRGWINQGDIQANDLVLGVNTETGLSEWQSIDFVVRKEKTKILKLSNKRVDLACSDRHRVLHSMRSSKGKFKYSYPGEIPSEFSIPVAAKSSAQGVHFSDDEIRLAAWVLTDGSIDPKYGYSFIYQSKPANVARIHDLLKGLGVPYTSKTRDRDIKEICGVALKSCLSSVEFRLGAQARPYIQTLNLTKGKLPDWAWELNDAQFRVFFNEVVRADGALYGDNRTGGIIYKDRGFLDHLQALCVANGVSANVTTDTRGHPRLNFCEKQFSDFAADTAKFVEEAYEGVVWCLKVKHGNFMVRRNGKAHFTGNCWGGGSDILNYILGQNAPAKKDSRIKLAIKLPNGKNVKVFASHSFAGRSMWSEVYGGAKKAQLDGAHHIYASGHIHTSGYTHGWNDAQQMMWHAVQIASYKKIDDYVEELNLERKDLYNCPVALIDPYAREEINFIRFEFDPNEAAERLKWMRGRWESAKNAS